jgi:BirA family biotin operon repressor/biotin-[acetyl-CoA-carboxylase] ligase
VRPALKWPNDLVADGRKLAGVLAETAPPAVVVGVGINVNWPQPLPVELEGTATALNHVSGRVVDGEDLLAALLETLGALYPDWDRVAAEYRRACSTVGQVVRVELGHESVEGTAVDLTDEGHLLLDVEGRYRIVASGDVVHLRAVAGHGSGPAR